MEKVDVHGRGAPILHYKALFGVVFYRLCKKKPVPPIEEHLTPLTAPITFSKLVPLK
jgi:hypothetical protein